MENGVKIDLSKTKLLKCNTKDCKSDTFIKTTKVRKLSKFLIKLGQDQIIYLETLECKECGKAITKKQLEDL